MVSHRNLLHNLEGIRSLWHGRLPQHHDMGLIAGFRLEAFRPAFGLAESGLVVTGVPSPTVPGVRYVDRSALGRNQVSDVAADAPTRWRWWAAALSSTG